MRYRRDKFSIDAGRAKGRPYPEWYLDCPDLLPGESMYMESFWDLETERPSTGGALGRIPWSKVRQYAIEELALEPCMLKMFWKIISELDVAFLGWQGKEFARVRRQA